MNGDAYPANILHKVLSGASPKSPRFTLVVGVGVFVGGRVYVGVNVGGRVLVGVQVGGGT